MSFLAARTPHAKCAADCTLVQGFSRGFGRELRSIEQVAGLGKLTNFPMRGNVPGVKSK
jgi:hypothetical protein